MQSILLNKDSGGCRIPLSIANDLILAAIHKAIFISKDATSFEDSLVSTSIRSVIDETKFSSPSPPPSPSEQQQIQNWTSHEVDWHTTQPVVNEVLPDDVQQFCARKLGLEKHDLLSSHFFLLFEIISCCSLL